MSVGRFKTACMVVGGGSITTIATNNTIGDLRITRVPLILFIFLPVEVYYLGVYVWMKGRRNLRFWGVEGSNVRYFSYLRTKGVCRGQRQV